ncbi:phytanoyl-CoA dioxygenase family protein [Beggiatoa leptomitoformis]|uniref:Phytanoyl-CoA dioxygenase n=1 Tax=Beggiatoa leptomitoformis TaxID=288004 RepID=A0A2N9YDL4_9GAMM|nr:phytanoyl-CoA dioxygenase family protein [Beggiatoa leptomitoformis]ALG69551.2 phytanoyl-CoA dioxygenase [Beggiatoa leptomitoformis]AUI68554.1 phytanoyl-CoA dioxygenase [Beggiatoa leptomitoformis]
MIQPSLTTAGFVLVPSVFSPIECETFATNIPKITPTSAGTRSLLSLAWCAEIVQRLRAHPILTSILSSNIVAVQCTYFEKSLSRNWLVSFHQDLSIPVAYRVEHPQLQGWSEKESGLFVQAPAALLAEMLAIRIHLDPCLAEDGALRVISGSHLLGRLNPQKIVTQRNTMQKEIICVAEQGSALVMRPLLLHASSKSSGTGLRRVLHFLFAPKDVLYGLQWRESV